MGMVRESAGDAVSQVPQVSQPLPQLAWLPNQRAIRG